MREVGWHWRHWLAGLVLLTLLAPAPARAHVGSPDVFFQGLVGPWPARITVHMPGVVPGRAELLVQIGGDEPATVTFTPLSAQAAISNAPPPEAALPVSGETNLYAGELWLMTSGAYSVEVRVRGKSGAGTVQIPVTSAATTVLPLPPWLGGVLVALALILAAGATAIAGAAAGESTLPPGAPAGEEDRNRYRLAACITGAVVVVALFGGKEWWDFDEAKSRAQIVSGGWPDLAAEVQAAGGQRVLHLTIGEEAFADSGQGPYLALAPDHGKLLHLFLVREPDHAAFAHVHPMREGDNTFAVALPPLPAGVYELFCDLTLMSGYSSTATNWVQLPPVPTSVTADGAGLTPDSDDSWITNDAVAVRERPGDESICHLSDGIQAVWLPHAPLRARRYAGLRFQVRDRAGQPVALEPYMGMLCHAAVLRADDRVFVHLHPTGNYSMAAQMLFDARRAGETGVTNPVGRLPGMTMNGSMMMDQPPGGASEFSIPYEFPSPGDYRIWVQFKIGGRIRTAIFDATVE